MLDEKKQDDIQVIVMTIVALVTAGIVVHIPQTAVWTPWFSRVLSATLIIGLSAGKLAEWIAHGFHYLHQQWIKRTRHGKDDLDSAKQAFWASVWWWKCGQYVVGAVLAILLAWILAGSQSVSP